MDVSPRRCQVAPHRLLVASLSESSGKPLKTLVQTVTRGGAGRLDVLFIAVSTDHRDNRTRCGMTYPGTLSQAVEPELVGDLGSIHGVLRSWLAKDEWNAEARRLMATYGQILLVGED